MFSPLNIRRDATRAILQAGNHMSAAARSQGRTAIEWKEADLHPVWNDVNMLVIRAQHQPGYINSPSFIEESRRILALASVHIPAERSTAYDPKQVMDGIGIVPRLL